MEHWSGNWAWSLPLIVATVTIHVLCMTFINDEVIRRTRGGRGRRNFIFRFAVVMGITTLLVTALHALEAMTWAMVFWVLGALPDTKAAMLYSLNAMTTYGHESIVLADHWRLMGAIEALNGVILFGLTTAFLYAIIREVWTGET